MRNSIVIGYDGTPSGDDALALGKELCEVLDAEPVVFMTLPIPGYLMDDEALDEAVREDSREPFERALEQLDGLEPRTVAVAAPSAAYGIHDFAAEEKPLMAVVGSTHRGALGRILLGSTGLRLVEGLPCALAIAPHGFAMTESPHLLRVGVALDPSPESRAALSAGVGLAERLRARLRLIAVQPVPKSTYSAGPAVAMTDLEKAEQQQATNVLREALDSMPVGVPADTVQPKGDPATRLGEESETLDLVVAGSRGYGPVRRVLLGSVTAALTKSAHCALLLVPRTAGENPLRFDLPKDALAESR